MLKETINKLAAIYKIFAQVHNANLLVAALPCHKVLSAIEEVIKLSCTIIEHMVIGGYWAPSVRLAMLG